VWAEFILQALLKWLRIFRLGKTQGTTKPLRAPREHLCSIELVTVLKYENFLMLAATQEIRQVMLTFGVIKAVSSNLKMQVVRSP
jgi:hypothetical protein